MVGTHSHRVGHFKGPPVLYGFEFLKHAARNLGRMRIYCVMMFI